MSTVCYLALAVALGISCSAGNATVSAPVPGNPVESPVQREWQRCLQRSAEVNPGDFFFRPEPQASRRFLAFLRKEAGMVPPGWWKQAIQKAWVTADGRLTSPNTAPEHYEAQPLSWKDPAGQRVSLPLNLPRRGMLRIANATLLVAGRHETVALPFFEAPLNSVESQLDAVVGKDRIFVASHSRSGEGLRVGCLDTKSRQVLWIRTLPGYGGATGSGRYHHNVSLHARNGKLWVWAAGSNCAGAWSLDAQTGALLCSFSTPARR